MLRDDHAGTDHTISVEIPQNEDIFAVERILELVPERRATVLDKLLQHLPIRGQIQGVEAPGEVLEIIEVRGSYFTKQKHGLGSNFEVGAVP
jgi:hypothetical protein